MVEISTNKYKKGKIYKLIDLTTTDTIYIGSSCNSLSRRKSQHHHTSKKHPNRNIYKFINELGWDKIGIVLIELYPCESKIELHRQERHWIEQLKPKMNMTIPTRTDKEYRTDNKDRIIRNRQILREKFPLKKIEKDRNYYQKNKDQINYRRKEKRKVKTLCECGHNYSMSNRAKHFLSKYHINHTNNQDNKENIEENVLILN